MKLLASFDGLLKVKLKEGKKPVNGFTYLSFIEIEKEVLLLSTQIHPNGNCSFYEERLETYWSPDGEGSWDVRVKGKKIGIELDPKVDQNFADDLSTSVSGDIISPKAGVAFKKDGDSRDNLVSEVVEGDLFHLDINVCTDDEWEDEGYW